MIPANVVHETQMSETRGLDFASENERIKERIMIGSNFYLIKQKSRVMHKYTLCLFTSGGALFNQADEHFGHFVMLRRYKKKINI